MININFHFPTCKYLMLFTWATLVYSQVVQWIFGKLLKLDGKFPDSLSPISILYYIYISIPYTIYSVYKFYTSPWLNTRWCVFKGYLLSAIQEDLNSQGLSKFQGQRKKTVYLSVYNTVMWLFAIKEILKCK